MSLDEKTNNDGLFARWYHTQSWQEAAKLARQIAELPEREDNFNFTKKVKFLRGQYEGQEAAFRKWVVNPEGEIYAVIELADGSVDSIVPKCYEYKFNADAPMFYFMDDTTDENNFILRRT